MVCILSCIRVVVSETLPCPTCARRSKISGQIAENFASGGAGSVSLTFSSKLAVEDVFLHCYSDLGGRAKSEFRPRWESEVGIPTSQPLAKKRAAVLLAREDLHFSDLGWRGSAGWRLRCQAEASIPGRDVACRMTVRPYDPYDSYDSAGWRGFAGQVAQQGGGFDAGQVARQGGGFDARQVAWQGGGFDAGQVARQRRL